MAGMTSAFTHPPAGRIATSGETPWLLDDMTQAAEDDPVTPVTWNRSTAEARLCSSANSYPIRAASRFEAAPKVGLCGLNEKVVSRHNNPTLHSSHRTFIMNSFKTSLIAKSIAAACFVAGLASSAVALEPNILGTPNDGTSCRSGYTGAFDGTSLKCSKTSKIAVQLVCIDPGFTRYVARVSAGGTQQGEDACAKSGGQVKFDSDDRIGAGSDFVQGTDWVLATADKVKIDEKTVARDLEEAAAFGGTAADVETVAGDNVFNRQANGIIDQASVTLTHFTFAISKGGLVGNQGPIGLPATAKSTSAFVPRSLPR